jgi:membrane-associated phospholipid phosphatase
MSWLHAADIAAFRFINQKLSNPFLDSVMPISAGGTWFVALALIAAILLLWKGGLRARLFVLVLGIVLGCGDRFVILPIKNAIARPRPSQEMADVKLSPWVGKGSARSMPSSHTSTWAAAALVAFAYYPRSWRVMVPVALLICFSRVYLGCHYPSDVLAGIVLGGGYAAAGLWALQGLWRWVGPKWFPAWHRSIPSLILRTTCIPLSAVS